MSAKQSAAPADAKALRSAYHNIVLFHREHMRFNATLQLEQAVAISREANKLKVIGDHWLREEDAARPDFDTSGESGFRGAGCADLTPLASVAGMGVLFMEGWGQPDEIRLLKVMLKTLGEGLAAKGDWLTETMERSWTRDRPMLRTAGVEGAWSRLGVVAVTWHGARERAMAGRVLLLALAHLEKIEFTPAAIRANRKAWGQLLLTAGWAMDVAASLLSRVAGHLSGLDPDMNDFLAYLGQEPA